jgi:hypothetical protein
MRSGVEYSHTIHVLDRPTTNFGRKAAIPAMEKPSMELPSVMKMYVGLVSSARMASGRSRKLPKPSLAFT